MKLYVVSDLHNEFTEFDPPGQAVNQADVIVLPGDIDLYTRGLDWARGVISDKRIIYVPGNHEYYGNHIRGLATEMREAARDLKIDYLDNDEVIIDDVRFLGCTLWTDFQLYGRAMSLQCMRTASRVMTDFAVIRSNNGGCLTPEESVELHRASHAWLESRLATPHDGPTVVVTHHLPSFLSVAHRFQNDPVSAAFASPLDDLVRLADVWIHGHTHDSFDYQIDECRVICNPRGYQRPGDKTPENCSFDPGLIVNVGKAGGKNDDNRKS
ncbi:MAG: metallophosphoesterase [Bryobacterales bacterium]|jgi:predicted phosphodiesterase|nr:metallophosphoesterase [Bryobacterales bacterium]